MSAVARVLNKTLVKPFYQANAGFFLITIGLLFGFLKTPQHIDIATALAYSPVYYIVPFGLFILYTIKTLQFCFTAKRLPTNQFMGWFVLLKPIERVPQVLLVQIQLSLPVLAYSALLLYTAIQHQLWLSASIVVGGNTLLILIAAHFLNEKLIRPTDPNFIGGFRLWTNRLPKSITMLFIHHLFNRQAVLLLGTKFISIAIVVGSIMIFRMEETDYRLLTLGLLLSGGINSMLSFHYHQFEQTSLTLLKNLPISSNTWFSKFTITYAILFIPEAIVFLGNTITSAPLQVLAGSILLPIGLLCFYQAVLYRKSIGTDQFIKYPFFTTAILFFVILGHVPAYSLVVLLMATSYLIFRFYYRGFDMIIDKD